jgi:hypothetical protein
MFFFYSLTVHPTKQESLFGQHWEQKKKEKMDNHSGTGLAF